MLNFINLNRQKFYVGDEHKFRGKWTRDGSEITPTSVNALVIKDDGTETVAETAGTISGNEVNYTYTDLVAGNYKLYFITVLSSTETETGVVPFFVEARGA